MSSLKNLEFHPGMLIEPGVSKANDLLLLLCMLFGLSSSFQKFGVFEATAKNMRALAFVAHATSCDSSRFSYFPGRRDLDVLHVRFLGSVLDLSF